jgi:cytokinesis protein
MSSDKSRQSSGGRSLFSRNKHKDKDKDKDKRNTEYDHNDTLSIISSRSSRHNRDSSAISIDGPPVPEGGVNMTAGVLTTIPYDATAPGSRSPIPVDYLPKADQMPVRRDPLPHQLNKSGVDFHQYPNFDSSSYHAGSHASVASSRNNPASSNVTMASTGRQAQYQQWGPTRGSMASTTNGSHTSRYESYLPPNGRTSDAFSVYSGKSETTPMYDALLTISSTPKRILLTNLFRQSL